MCVGSRVGKELSFEGGPTAVQLAGLEISIWCTRAGRCTRCVGFRRKRMGAAVALVPSQHHPIDCCHGGADTSSSAQRPRVLGVTPLVSHGPASSAVVEIGRGWSVSWLLAISKTPSFPVPLPVVVHRQAAAAAADTTRTAAVTASNSSSGGNGSSSSSKQHSLLVRCRLLAALAEPL